MNPFMKDGYMLPIASINSIYVDHQLAGDMFRPGLLIAEIMKHNTLFGINKNADDKTILRAFDVIVFSKDHPGFEVANSIISLFSDNFSQVFKTIFKPSIKSIINRRNWTDEHWKYWKGIKNVFFVGGITELRFIQIIEENINQLFLTDDIDVHAEFVPFSGNIGTKGLSIIALDGESLLFDFGQTNIKRSFVLKKNNKIIKSIIFDTKQSTFLEYKNLNSHDLTLSAKQLHNYIIDCIMETATETDFKGSTVLMSIANYVYKGKIFLDRGGYGKLAMLSENYCVFLSKELSSKLNRIITVKMYHDTTAMAIPFKNKRNSAIISLGTAFGIAFPV